LENYLYGFLIFFLIVLGALAAKICGLNIIKSIVRITFGRPVAMGLFAFVGHLFGVNIA
jgi:VIT1/CCC1 family predicted Fe2+/Mn2+ transporter